MDEYFAVKACKRFIVSGKVQGVWYRGSTVQKAQQLGLDGWVKNLINGDVELIACGESAALEQLESWLWQGPQTAKVTDVKSFALKYQHFEQFEVR